MEIVLVMGGFIAFVSFYIHAVANRKSDDKPLSANKNTPIKTFDYGINLRSNKETANSFETNFSSGKLNPYYKKTYRDDRDNFKLKTDLRIKYIDRFGKSSQRDITTKSISMDFGDGAIEAYCHTKRGNRTFKLDRIIECIDLETGEFIEDVYRYLRGKI